MLSNKNNLFSCLQAFEVVVVGYLEVVDRAGVEVEDCAVGHVPLLE